MEEDRQTRAEALALYVANGGLNLEERVERAEQHQREIDETSKRQQKTIDAIKQMQDGLITIMQGRIAALELLAAKQHGLLAICSEIIRDDHPQASILERIENTRKQAESLINTSIFH